MNKRTDVLQTKVAIKLETFNLITSLTNIEGLSDNVKEMTTIETKTLTFKAINLRFIFIRSTKKLLKKYKSSIDITKNG